MSRGLPIRLTRRHRQLIDLVREHWGRLALSMVCMLVIAAATASTAYLVKPVLDDIFFSRNQRMLTLIPVAVVLIYLLRGVGMYAQEYLMSYVGERIILKLRTLLYDRIQDLPVSFFQHEKTGVLMSRITNDVNVIKAMVSFAVTSSLKDVFTILGLVGVIFYRDWKMAIFALVILPLAFFPVVEFGRRVRRASTGCQEAMADLNVFLHETIAGNKIVKAFGRETHEKNRFREKTEALFKVELRAVVARSLSSPVMEFLGGVGIAFIIWYGGSKVIAGTSTAGTFFSFMAAVLMLYDPVKKITRLNNVLQQGMAAADRVFDILETGSDILDPPEPVRLPRQPHRVAFEDAWFRYDDAWVLKGIDLAVAEGEVLALVGMSGGGKTTLVNLIPRFFDVRRGAVTIDGIDIRRFSLADLRGQIAVVTQEPILFNDTVRYNIAYGRPDAGESEIIAAAEAANALNFIRSLPQGLDTPIGELGGRLSGGEKQRLCIARALIKDAPILILDEATSALDTEAEMLVQQALVNLMQGRTTFVIAHRLSTVEHADRIAVVVDGRIVEQGTHADLLACKGEYCKLYQMQFGNGTD